jgi:hypothetical protein
MHRSAWFFVALFVATGVCFPALAAAAMFSNAETIGASETALGLDRALSPSEDILAGTAKFSGDVNERIAIEGRIAPGRFTTTGGHPAQCERAENIAISWGDNAKSGPCFGHVRPHKRNHDYGTPYVRR